jgi:hypothetical protein
VDAANTKPFYFSTTNTIQCFMGIQPPDRYMAQPHLAIIANVPTELLRSRSWIIWREEIRKERPTKVPYDPKSGLLAETDDPSTWGTLAEAQRALDLGGYSGLGYVRTAMTFSLT